MIIAAWTPDPDSPDPSRRYGCGTYQSAANALAAHPDGPLALWRYVPRDMPRPNTPYKPIQLRAADGSVQYPTDVALWTTRKKWVGWELIQKTVRRKKPWPIAPPGAFRDIRLSNKSLDNILRGLAHGHPWESYTLTCTNAYVPDVTILGLAGAVQAAMDMAHEFKTTITASHLAATGMPPLWAIDRYLRLTLSRRNP